jgi:hypothetical protein
MTVTLGHSLYAELVELLDLSIRPVGFSGAWIIIFIVLIITIIVYCSGAR